MYLFRMQSRTSSKKFALTELKNVGDTEFIPNNLTIKIISLLVYAPTITTFLETYLCIPKYKSYKMLMVKTSTITKVESF